MSLWANRAVCTRLTLLTSSSSLLMPTRMPESSDVIQGRSKLPVRPAGQAKCNNLLLTASRKPSFTAEEAPVHIAMNVDGQYQTGINPDLSIPFQNQTLFTAKSRSSLDSPIQYVPRTFTSAENLDIHGDLLRIYQGLRQNRMQIQHLKQELEVSLHHSNVQTSRSLIKGMQARHYERSLAQPKEPSDSDSNATDDLFDSVSIFSTDQEIPSGGLRTKISGGPEDLFERSSGFSPEQHSTVRSFNHRIVTVAITDLSSTEFSRVDKYFIFYAEAPWRWRRVTVLAYLKSQEESLPVSRTSANDSLEHSCKILPRRIESLLVELLPNMQFFDTVTSLSLSLTALGDGEIVPDWSSTVVAEDKDELVMCKYSKHIEEIENMDCPQYSESEVTVKSQISATSWVVWVECQTCIERKLPFARSGLDGENDVESFFNDLKLCYRLRECVGVAQFKGVVLDDTRIQVKSYICEFSELGSLQQLLETAEQRSETIPWERREVWARQVVTAVSEVHRKGLVLGVLQPDSIGITEEGEAVLTSIRTSKKQLTDRIGCLPPELRLADEAEAAKGSANQSFNYRTDVFQLGFIIWLLAEHMSSAYGYFCRKAACATVPRDTCTAEHGNPIHLPPCGPEVPQYINEIISKSRATSAKARPPARELLEQFPPLDSSRPCTP